MLLSSLHDSLATIAGTSSICHCKLIAACLESSSCFHQAASSIFCRLQQYCRLMGSYSCQPLPALLVTCVHMNVAQSEH